jgi:hypothetical protein
MLADRKVDYLMVGLQLQGYPILTKNFAAVGTAGILKQGLLTQLQLHHYFFPPLP